MEELTGYNLPDGDYWVKKIQQDENGILIVLESKQLFGDNSFLEVLFTPCYVQMNLDFKKEIINGSINLQELV